VSGTTSAITALGAGAGSVNVTSTGGLTATAGDAIHTSAGTGAITLNVSGGPISSTRNALSATGAGQDTVNNSAAIS